MDIARVGQVPGRGPFPHVARHVVQAVGTHAVTERTHRRGIAFLLELGPMKRGVGLAGIEVVPPRKYAAIGAARALLLFLVGWQSLAGSASIGVGIVPSYFDHRVVGLAGGNSTITEMGRRAAAGRID